MARHYTEAIYDNCCSLRIIRAEVRLYYHYRFMYAVVSDVSSTSCNFDDMDICGYQDLSISSTKWLHIHNQSKSILSHFCPFMSDKILQEMRYDNSNDDELKAEKLYRYVRRGFIANSVLNLRVKNFENRST